MCLLMYKTEYSDTALACISFSQVQDMAVVKMFLFTIEIEGCFPLKGKNRAVKVLKYFLARYYCSQVILCYYTFIFQESIRSHKHTRLFLVLVAVAEFLHSPHDIYSVGRTQLSVLLCCSYDRIWKHCGPQIMEQLVTATQIKVGCKWRYFWLITLL